MKILMITPYLGSTYGGPAKMVTELAQALGNYPCQIDLVSTNANNWETLPVPLNIWIDCGNYRLQYFPCWHRQDFIFSFSLIQWLFKNIHNYHLIHTNTIFSPLISAIHKICQFKKKPYIITPHGMLESWALSYKAQKKFIYYYLIEKSILQKASAIHALVRAEANNIKSLGINSSSAIIPNGIHRHTFNRLPERQLFEQEYPYLKNKTIILFLGRIDPKKGLDLLAPAFAQAHARFPHTHLVVAGPDSIAFLPRAKSFFADAGCLEAVTFTGMLQGDLKLSALAAASLYIAPSYSEGFSMSVLEGMASELPCIITSGCNFPEAAQAQAAKVVNINPNAIADALIDCLQNAPESQEMGKRARQLIFEQYTWDKVATQLMAVYTAIIEQQPIPNFY